MRVLVGVDDSAVSRNATALGAALARQAGGEVHLVHVVPHRPAVRGTVPPLQDSSTATEPGRQREIAVRLLEGVGAAFAGRVETSVRHGSTAEQLLLAAKEERSRMIVLGTRGHGPLSRAFVGSASRSVLREALCPVLLAPASLAETPEAITRILAGVDSGPRGAAVVAATTDIAASIGAAVTLAHIAPVTPWPAAVIAGGARASSPPPTAGADAGRPARWLRALADAGERAGIEVDVCARHGSPVEELSCLADEIGAGVIAVGIPRRSAMSAAVLGSVPSALIAAGDRPILLVRSAPPA